MQIHITKWPAAKTQTRNGGPTMMVGDRVRLVTPDNPRLHGSTARILTLTEWGAHCSAPAAATGSYRAAWSEMEPMGKTKAPAVEYTGNPCNQCGSARMRRSGSCSVCEDCGESGGCS